MKIRAIITGTTGMVGEGVLHECLQHPDVEQVLVINRKPCGVTHSKLKEIIHPNFFDLTSIENQLKGFNACFFCLGVSSVGMKEPEYHRMTYDLTIHVAEIMVKNNQDMVFCYVSGSGTDGKSMWARVKSKTEKKLQSMPFRKAFMFRPGYMHPTLGLKNTLPSYRFITWMYPLSKILFPKFVSTLADLGQAMINVATTGYEKSVLEVTDIVTLAHRERDPH